MATNEKRGIYFTAVPHKWEINKILYWPTSMRNSERKLLRSNPARVPESSWDQFSYILKLTNIKTFEEALRLEKQLTDCSDSEAEYM